MYTAYIKCQWFHSGKQLTGNWKLEMSWTSKCLQELTKNEQRWNRYEIFQMIHTHIAESHAFWIFSLMYTTSNLHRNWTIIIYTLVYFSHFFNMSVEFPRASRCSLGWRVLLHSTPPGDCQQMHVSLRVGQTTTQLVVWVWPDLQRLQRIMWVFADGLAMALRYNRRFMEGLNEGRPLQHDRLAYLA